MRLPRICTARYFAWDREPADGGFVAVRISARSPEELGVGLPYAVEETAGGLIPLPETLGEWWQLCPRYLAQLDASAEKVVRELSGISGRHGGKPLMLLCWEDTHLAGHGCHRKAFQAWFEGRFGEPVYELTGGGTRLHHTELHPRRKVRWS